MSLRIEVEVKLSSDPCVVAWENNLYVGTDDGYIKCFDANLTPGASWQAHSLQLFALAASNNHIYSASNDGGVRVWTPTGEKIAELPSTDADVGVIRVFDKNVYAGDEAGNVMVYEDNKVKASYNLLEEVKDIAINPPFLFTVRDLYVTVTEIKPEESKTRFITRHTLEGRAPIRIAGAYLLVLTRDGNTLRLLDCNLENKFKKLHEIKVSDMIITSLSENGDYAWTGGWDGHVKRWKISDNKLEASGELNLGSCINALVSPTLDTVYTVLAGGRVVKIKAV